jgi:hypothetical protein
MAYEDLDPTEGDEPEKVPPIDIRTIPPEQYAEFSRSILLEIVKLNRFWRDYAEREMRLFFATIKGSLPFVESKEDGIEFWNVWYQECAKILDVKLIEPPKDKPAKLKQKTFF